MAAIQSPQKVIFTSITVVVVAAIIEHFAAASGTPAATTTIPHILLGAFIATALLILLSYILPEFAEGIAGIAALGMIITKGEPFWAALNNILGSNTGSIVETPPGGVPTLYTYGKSGTIQSTTPDGPPSPNG
jgi:hypothetical protein